MLEFIKGKIIKKSVLHLVVESGGIGFFINTSIFASESAGKIGDEINIPVHLHIKESPFSVSLYGFCDELERDCFRKIISVSGIGPKTAITILSAINYSELISLISNGDYGKLTKINGVGKKTAERLAVELKDKIGKYDFEPAIAVKVNEFSPVLNKSSEVVAALTALGYSKTDAEKLLKEFSAKNNFNELTIEAIVREVLRNK